MSSPDVLHIVVGYDGSIAAGASLARAAGWAAESRIERSLGGEGLQFAQVADQAGAALLLVGSRGLGGARAVLGSFSDMVVHYSPRPVLVVPHPLLSGEQAVLAAGPVAVGWDGSPGARAAYAAARALLPGREFVLVSVDGAAGSEPSPGAEDAPVTMVEMTSGIGGRGRAIAEALSAGARNRGAALIVVGSRGRSAVREILVGSVAMGTLHHAYRPVLVVPQPGRRLSLIRTSRQRRQSRSAPACSLNIRICPDRGRGGEEVRRAGVVESAFGMCR